MIELVQRAGRKVVVGAVFAILLFFFEDQDEMSFNPD